MNHHPPGAHELARRLLESEQRSAGGGTVADAVESALGKLSRTLEPLVGKGGVDALVTRAVHLARRGFPFLGAARPNALAPVDFPGMRESLASRDAAEAREAGIAVLESLVGLLVGLLGEELGLRLVGMIWPDAVHGEQAPDSNQETE